MLSFAETIDSIADENGFAGVVSVDRGGEIEFVKAYGAAHRAHQIPNTVDTRFAIASGVKGLTALAVVSLVESGALSLSRRFVGIGWNLRPLSGGAMARVYDISSVSRLFTERVQCLRTGLLTPIDQRHQLRRPYCGAVVRPAYPGI